MRITKSWFTGLRKAIFNAAPALALALCSPGMASEPGSELKDYFGNLTGGKVQLRFEIRSRAEFRNAAEFGNGPDLHGQFIRTRIGADFQPATWVRLSVLGQDARVPFLGRSAPGAMRDPFDLQEAYAELFAHRPRGFSGDIGRRMVQYGDTRLIGAPQWAYTARTYDLGRVSWKTGNTKFELLLVSPIKPNGRAFNSPILGDRVWGTYNTFAALGGRATLDVYALRHDQNSPGGFTGAGRLATDSFGFRLVTPLDDRTRFTLETIAQRGRIGELPHRAYAWALQASRKADAFGRSLETQVEYKFASGSDRPERSGTFDQLYPAAHDKIGHADLLGWRNIRNLKITTTYQVSKAFALTGMYNDSWLAVVTDAAYNLQGRPIARARFGDAGSHLGREADLYATYRRGPLLFGAGAGYFFTGRFLENTTRGLDQRLLYVFQTYSF